MDHASDLPPPGKRTLPRSFKLSDSSTYRTVELLRDEGGYGIGIAGGKMSDSDTVHPVFIKHIKPGSVAERQGELRVRDRVVSVNGVEVEGMPHDSIVDLMRESQKVTLVIEPRPRKSDFESSSDMVYFHAHPSFCAF